MWGCPLLCRGGACCRGGVARSCALACSARHAYGLACLDVCACGYGREYEGVPHRPGVRERRERARPSRDAARSTRSVTRRSDTRGQDAFDLLRRMWSITSNGEYTPLPGLGPKRVTCSRLPHTLIWSGVGVCSP